MPTPPQTKPGRLSDVARHLLLPTGVTHTGWPAVRTQAAKVGIVYDEWQDGLGRAILSKREGGQYASSIGGIVVSMCRQVGKTFTVGSIIVMLCILTPGMKVLWTAHRTRTSDETFKSLSALVKRKAIRPFLLKEPRQANGQQEITFANGSRILFGAREQGFGRGFDDVDVEVFDEAQILGQKALDDMIAAMNVAENPLYLLIGTPPKPGDPSEAFATRRREALDLLEQRKAGQNPDVDMLFVEISADPETGRKGGPALDDRGQWRKGNPSYPHRTRETAMLRLRRALGDASFRREGLGIWDDDSGGTRLIPASDWTDLAVPTHILGTPSFGIAFSGDGMRTSLAGAMKHATGVHVELIDARAGAVEAGIERLADWLEVRWRKTASIVISGRAGAALLHKALRDRGVPDKVITLASTNDYTTACATFLKAVHDQTVSHLDHPGQAALDASVAISDRKERGARGSGAWGWQATTSDGDETPMEAVSLALWGAVTTRRKPGRRQEVI